MDTYNGEYSYSRIDVALSGRGPAFWRSYDSGDPRETPLGPGWTANIFIGVATTGDPAHNDDRLVVQTNDRPDYYAFGGRDAAGQATFHTPVARDDALVQNADKSYTLRHPDGSHVDFDAAGLLQAFVAKDGSAAKIEHDGRQLPTAMHDPAGRGVLAFAYAPTTSPRLASVSDWLSPPRVVRFGYDARNRLTSVTDREGQTTQYTYAGDTARLATIQDARSHVAISVLYEPLGRAAAQTDARGQQSTFTYQDNSDGTSTTTGIYPPSSLDPTWRTVVVDTYDSLGRLTQRETRPGPADDPLVETRTYDATWHTATRPFAGGTVAPPPDASPEPGDGSADTASGFADLPAAVQPWLPTPRCLPGHPTLDLAGQSGVPPDPRALASPLRLETQAPSQPQLDAVGRITSITTGDAAAAGTWRIRYDNEDRVRFIDHSSAADRTPAGVTELRYDAVGNLVESIGADGGSTRYAYDERDALVEVDMPTGDQIQYVYDDRGDATHATFVPVDGGPTQIADYVFDGLRRPRRVERHAENVDPSVVTLFSYADEGRCSRYLTQP